VETVRKVFTGVIEGCKALVSLLRGENKALAKKLLACAILMFIAVCTFMTLCALHKAKKEAAE
jgi:hypothetical protein